MPQNEEMSYTHPAIAKASYASQRYESLCLKERKNNEELDEISEAFIKKDAGTSKETTKIDDKLLSLHASNLVCRASMIGMMESHIYSSAQNKDAEVDVALASLLEHQLKQYDRNCFSHENPFLLSSAFEKMSVGTLSVNDTTKEGKPSCDEEKEAFRLDHSILEDIDTDSFFERFPECVHDSKDDDLYSAQEYYDDALVFKKSNIESDNRADDKFEKQFSKENCSGNVKNGRDQNKDSKQTSLKSINAEPMVDRPINPYARKNMTDHRVHKQEEILDKSDDFSGSHSFPLSNVDGRNGRNRSTMSSWDTYENVKAKPMPHSRTNQYNESNLSENEFRTARELSSYNNILDENQAEEYGNFYPNGNQHLNEMNSFHPRHDHQFQIEPHQNQQQQFQQQSAAQIRGPILSAGLKRKFKPPKLQVNKNNKGKLAQSANKRYCSKPSHPDDTNGSKEEELPDELKHLDKELVEKIEHEILDNGESVTFNDIAGLKNAKQTVLELVCWPMKRPDLFTGLRKGPNGLLLFGPPGTGKTLIGKAVAHESGATFFSISSSSLTSKWIGEGEKLVKTLFAVAMYRQPAVVFIDEIDSLLTQRKSDENEASRRIKTEFLVQLDGTGGSTNTGSNPGMVLVIGATNRPHELDDAARRRFVKRIYIPLPERSDREILLRTLLNKNSHCMADKDILRLSHDTDGFSGADLKALCTDAALGPIRQLGERALLIKAEDVPPISYRHFRTALRGMNPSVAQSDLDVYLKWNESYGSMNIHINQHDDDSSVNSNESS